MDPSRALARLSDVASHGLPLAQRFLQGARRRVDELSLRILGADFEERAAWLRQRYEGMGGDPFGLDPDTARSAAMVCAFFHRAYFRTTCVGLEHLPEGRVLLVANHSGQIPIDAAIIGTALFLDAEPPRVTRAMVERWTGTLPFVSTFYSRVGQVVGVPENAKRLLEMDEVLLTFPEGLRGISKPFTARYQLQEFGLGFMRLALSTNTPIVPVAVVGAEEQYVSLGNLRGVAKALNLPVFPLIPQLLVPGGQLPLPMKYRLHFGEPLRFVGDPEEDDKVIGDKVWLVKQTISALLNEALASRTHLFF
ncbi:MAG TPA: lysophospholipid acyltransferase family protein [Polyangiaceae bacterium]|nr:lysophospholipid acyltransferase family protein [Polyangiaceae bacterium]